VIVDISLFVGADMHADNPEFTVVNTGIALLEIGFTLPHRLDFGSLENDTRLVFLEDEVIVKSFFIFRYDFHGYLPQIKINSPPRSPSLENRGG